MTEYRRNTRDWPFLPNSGLLWWAIFSQVLPLGFTKTFSDLHHSLGQSFCFFSTFIFIRVTSNKLLVHLILSQCLLLREPKWHRLHVIDFLFWAISVSCYYLYYYFIQPQTETFNTGRNLLDGHTDRSLEIKRLEYVSGPATHWLSRLDKSYDLSE